MTRTRALHIAAYMSHKTDESPFDRTTNVQFAAHHQRLHEALASIVLRGMGGDLLEAAFLRHQSALADWDHVRGKQTRAELRERLSVLEDEAISALIGE